MTAMEAANKAVWQLAQGSREKRGMGTTMTTLALVQVEGEEQLALANVGDSRTYLLQQGELLQLTEDHSLVEELVRDGKLTPAEAQTHPQRSIITRALGMEPAIEVDSWEIIPYQGDRILLCSDGLTNELSDERIASTLRQLADPQEAARDLVRQARAAGGSDNITVVVVDVVDDGGRSARASDALATSTGPSKPAPAPTVSTFVDSEASARASVAAPPAPEPAAPPRPAPPPPPAIAPRRWTWRVAVFLVALLAVLGAAVWAVAWYARSAYFVGLDGEQVVGPGVPTRRQDVEDAAVGGEDVERRVAELGLADHRGDGRGTRAGGRVDGQDSHLPGTSFVLDGTEESQPPVGQEVHAGDADRLRNAHRGRVRGQPAAAVRGDVHQFHAEGIAAAEDDVGAAGTVRRDRVRLVAEFINRFEDTQARFLRDFGKAVQGTADRRL